MKRCLPLYLIAKHIGMEQFKSYSVKDETGFAEWRESAHLYRAKINQTHTTWLTKKQSH